MSNQIFGTAIDTKCALLSECLTICYQKETKLFTQELPKYFSNEECLLIKEFFKRSIDDGFIFRQKFQSALVIYILQLSTHPKKQK